MKIAAKRNFVYHGKVYKVGELVEVTALEAAELNYFLDGKITSEVVAGDSFVVAESLPPLDEPIKRGKKNGNA